MKKGRGLLVYKRPSLAHDCIGTLSDRVSGGVHALVFFV